MGCGGSATFERGRILEVVGSRAIQLVWQRFPRLTAARAAFARQPCIYVTADKSDNAIRVGLASKGLEARYRGGTGYAIDAAMHDSGNSIFVAGVTADLCGVIELELIWRGRDVLAYNKVGKRRPPVQRLMLEHYGNPPRFQGFHDS
jgi:hypothetical protein